MQAITKELCPKVNENVISRSNAHGRISIMNIDEEEFMFTLDGLAAKAWDLMDGNHSLSDIEQIIGKETGLPQRFEADLFHLVQELSKNGLIA